jgi:hypothetical protein
MSRPQLASSFGLGLSWVVCKSDDIIGFKRDARAP